MLPVTGRLRFGLSLKSLVFGSAASFIACLMWTGMGGALAETPGACAKLSDVEIVQLLNKWRLEFTSGNSERLSTLYADDATLVATKDGKPYKGKEAIRSYYEDLLAKHPTLSIKPSSLTPGCGTATVSGPVVYRITGERKGTRMLLGGRYTAEYGLREGTWRIVRHSLAADPRSAGDPIDPARAGKPSPPL